MWQATADERRAYRGDAARRKRNEPASMRLCCKRGYRWRLPAAPRLKPSLSKGGAGSIKTLYAPSSRKRHLYSLPTLPRHLASA